MARIEKTVFISYRHKDISWALLVYKSLTEKDYDVFFDFTSIPSGDFEQIIIGNIKARAHFLVILTPTALDRCSEPGDWLRREIETAINERRNIIPLFFDGFKFGDPLVSKNLSGKLESLKKYNGIDIPEGYFDEAMERLCTRYLNVALDAVLHPVSADVQKVVKREKIAADQAVVGQTEVLIENKPKTTRTSHAGGKNVQLQKDRNEKQGPEDRSEQNEKPALASAPLKKTDPRNKIELQDILKIGVFDFVNVPAGEFIMGSPDNNQLAYEAMRDGKVDLPPKYPKDEWPRHVVDIPYDYWISKFTVTNKRFALYTGAIGRKHPIFDWEEKPDHPVTKISWNLAITYSKWLSGLFKNDLPRGLVFRLPTEAEWEKAARGVGGCEWPWGNEFDNKKCNAGHDYDAKIERSTTPVGHFSPQGDSPYGCSDMAGNIYEWTLSLFKNYPYDQSDGREDLKAPGDRVVRGGWYGSTATKVRTASRAINDNPFRSSLLNRHSLLKFTDESDEPGPNRGDILTGFRLVLGPPLRKLIKSG